MRDKSESSKNWEQGAGVCHPDPLRSKTFVPLLEELVAVGSQLRAILGSALGQRLWHPGSGVGGCLQPVGGAEGTGWGLEDEG